MTDLLELLSFLFDEEREVIDQDYIESEPSDKWRDDWEEYVQEYE